MRQYDETFKRDAVRLLEQSGRPRAQVARDLGVSDVSLAIVPRASHTYNAIHPLVHVPFELTLAAEISAHFVNAYA